MGVGGVLLDFAGLFLRAVLELLFFKFRQGLIRPVDLCYEPLVDSIIENLLNEAVLYTVKKIHLHDERYDDMGRYTHAGLCRHL